MKITIGMVPLAIGAVALASCGVSSGPRLDGIELPPFETTTEVDPASDAVGSAAPVAPVPPVDAAPAAVVGEI